MIRIDRTAMRIIDANLNRAREALRVMEEYARLGLEDVGLATAIKETRHALAAAACDLETGEGCDTERTSGRAEPRGSLIAHRNIIGDVGCDIAVPAEYERSDARHVALAAGKRLSEALRAIEEYGKAIDPALAVAVERIRYGGYELERRLSLAAHAQDRFAHVRLYVIVTESLCSGKWRTTAEAALRGGADCLQLREKDLPDRELLKRAKQLAARCHEHDAMFIVNDRPDIAELSGADGVHLGRNDLPVAAARRIVSSTSIVGVSTHTTEQVAAAAAEAPDYIAVGPMFATATKREACIAGPATLAAARKLTSLPLVPIGGIDERNVIEVLSAGANAVSVCRAVVAQPDAADAAAHLRALIDRALRKSPAET